MPKVKYGKIGPPKSQKRKDWLKKIRKMKKNPRKRKRSRR